MDKELAPRGRQALIREYLRVSTASRMAHVAKRTRQELEALSDEDLIREYRRYPHHDCWSRPYIRYSPKPTNYVDGWKRAKRYAPTHKGWEQNYQGYITALHNRINKRAGDERVMLRKCGDLYQTGLIRDRRAIWEKLNLRVRLYGLETPELRKRFAHLIDDRNEV